MNYSFVILHYSTIEDTKRCVESIDRIDRDKHDSVDIVVVDNCSPNGSGAQLKKCFEDRSDVHTLLLNENVGFANGNNYGYRYAKDNCSPDFIVVSNNDVVFPQRDFMQKLKMVHEETHFDLCGPDIVVPASGFHQNPVSLHSYSRDDVVSTIALYERKLRGEERGGVSVRLKQAISSLLSLGPVTSSLAFIRNWLVNRNWMKRCISNPIIHGACVICGPRFIESEDTVFWPGTFMYFEEPILNYLCAVKGYRMAYCPELVVLHNEDSSTNYSYSSRLARKRFKYQNGIDSGNAFLNLIDRCGEKEQKMEQSL